MLSLETARGQFTSCKNTLASVSNGSHKDIDTFLPVKFDDEIINLIEPLGIAAKQFLFGVLNINLEKRSGRFLTFQGSLRLAPPARRPQ